MARLALLGSLALFLLPAPASPAPQDSKELAGDLIDRYISQTWSERKISPAKKSDQDEFLRRATLDLIGTIPSAEEAREYLKNQGSNKRNKLIEALIESDAYSDHWGRVWTDILFNDEAEPNGEIRRYLPLFTQWLAGNFFRNTPMDEIVRKMLNARGDLAENPAAVYLAKNIVKNEGALDAAADLSSHFLGISISCAKCHDHPFAKWTRQNFFQTAAFFARVRARRSQPSNDLAARWKIDEDRGGEVHMPKSGDDHIPGPIKPKFLAETDPENDKDRRAELADIMTVRNNKQFARAVVNRYWAYFMGRGIIHPVNGFDDKNQPSHPELLDRLADQFIAHKFDTKWLVRSIVYSDTYQLSSRSPSNKPAPDNAFAHAAIRPLTPHQIHSALIRATGGDKPEWRRKDDKGNPVEPEITKDYVRNSLAQVFQVDVNDAGKFKVTIQQALAMMNADLVHGAVSCMGEDGLVYHVNKEYDSTGERIDYLFLAILSRHPDPKETAAANEHLRNMNGRPEAFEDIAWALLNSSEFIFNH